MTMRIVVLKSEGDLKEGVEYFIDRAKAVKMIEDGKATTPNLYEKIVKKKAEESAKEAEAKALAEEQAREEARKKELLAKKEAEAKKAKEATSQKARGRTRAVKK
jgi:hypothetical protein